MSETGNRSSNARNDDDACYYNVEKLQLFFEYLSASDIVVERAGFVRIEERDDGSHLLRFVDDVQRGEAVHLRSTNAKDRRGRLLRCEQLIPDRGFYLPNRGEELEEDEWVREYSFVDTIARSQTLSNAIRIRIEPQPDFRRTRVLFYWHVWNNLNTLDTKFAQWFSSNADATTVKRIRDMPDSRTVGGGTRTIATAVQRRLGGSETVLSSARDNTTWLKSIDQNDRSTTWHNSAQEYYLFTFIACDFNRARPQQSSLARHSLASICIRSVRQSIVQRVYRLERALHSGRRQLTLTRFLRSISTHLQRCAYFDSAIAPTFSENYDGEIDDGEIDDREIDDGEIDDGESSDEKRDTIPSLDPQQRQCLRFLRRRQKTAFENPLRCEIQELCKIIVGDTGWRYICDDQRLLHSTNDVDCRDEREASERRERTTAFPLCAKCFSADPCELYDTLCVDAGLGWLKWRTMSVPSKANRFTILGGAPHSGKRVALLSHLLVDCQHHRNKFFKSMMRSRTAAKSVSSYRYLANQFDSRSIETHQLFARLSSLTNGREQRLWSRLQTESTLLLCDESNVWRWLMVLSTLNDRQSVFVAQSDTHSNVFHVVRSNSDVRMRLHCIRTLREYATFTFADVLTSDIVLVTYQLLAQLAPEHCSYVRPYNMEESIERFAHDRWMTCVRHEMNVVERRSLARLCSSNVATQNVPLEAIHWRTLIYDDAPRVIVHRKNKHMAIERKMMIVAYDKFSSVVQASHVIGLQSERAPSLSDCHRQWRHCLVSTATAEDDQSNVARREIVPKDFLLNCARRFEHHSLRNDGATTSSIIGTRSPKAFSRSRRLGNRTLFLTPSIPHSAIIRNTFNLLCQLQDIQALKTSMTVRTDGVFRRVYTNRYPTTVHASTTLANRISHLKPSFRYALHFCEHNRHFGTLVLLRNLTQQILRRSARFLSQNNVDHNVVERNSCVDESMTDASDAFHAMLRYSQASQHDTSGDVSSSAMALTPAESLNGQQEEEEGDEGEEEEEEDQDSMDSNSNDEDEGSIGRQRILLGSIVIALNSSVDGDDSSGSSGDMDNEDFDLTEHVASRMSTTLDRDTDRYDFLSDIPSLDCTTRSWKITANSDEYDTETCIGWSRALNRRMLMQRSEALSLRCSASLPYDTCITSVSDRQIVSFINLLANSRRLLPSLKSLETVRDTRGEDGDPSLRLRENASGGHDPSLRLRENAEDDGDIQEVEDEGEEGEGERDTTTTFVVPLNDYERYYEMLRPPTIGRHGGPLCDDCMQRTATDIEEDSLSALVRPHDAVIVDAHNDHLNGVLARRPLSGEVLRKQWNDASDAIEQNNKRLMAHYCVTLDALRNETQTCDRLFCNQVRLLVVELLEHKSRPLTQRMVDENTLVAQCVAQPSAVVRFESDEKGAATAEQMYTFYADVLRPLLTLSAISDREHPLSLNLSYCCEQISHFRRNTRWLRTDAEFVESQMTRIAQSRSSMQQTLRRIEATSSTKTNGDNDCGVCLDSCNGRDIALFPCGHWCCFSCYEDGGRLKYRVEAEEERYVGASLAGERCVVCRYVLQHFESVKLVHQSDDLPPSIRESDYLPLLVGECEADVRASPREAVGLDHERQSRSREAVGFDIESRQTMQSRIPLRYVSGESDSRSPKRIRATHTTHPQTGNFESAFVKCDTIMRWLTSEIMDRVHGNIDDSPFRCVLVSQYATQLHEVYDMLQKWLERESLIDKQHVCVLYCPSATHLIERQSSDYFQCHVEDRQRDEKDVRCGQKRKHTDSGSSSVEPIGCKPVSAKEKHIVVFHHIDVTRNLLEDEHAAMYRDVPPLYDLSHLVFCESICVRMRNDKKALRRTVEIEQRLLRQLKTNFVRRKVQCVRIQLMGSVDEYLYNETLQQTVKMEAERAAEPQFKRDALLL